MAFASEYDQGADRSASTIIICTPTGLEMIEWDLGGETPPSHTHGQLCPLCTSAADVSPPLAMVSRMAIERYERYAPSPPRRYLMVASISYDPARAPPF